MSRSRPKRKKAMHLDHDNMDDILDRAMGKLDDELASIDYKLDAAMDDMDAKLEKAMSAVKKATAHGPLQKKHKHRNTGGVSISMGSRTPKEHSFTFTSEEGSHVIVKYNNEADYSIQTDGDLNFTSSFTKDIRRRIIEDAAQYIIDTPSPRRHDSIYNRDGTLSEHILKTAQDIANRARDTKVKQTVTFTDKYTVQDPREVLRLNIWAENFLGSPIKSETPTITIDTKVRVAERSGLSALLLPNHPGYQVFIKDTEIWMCKMEDMMYRASLIAGNEAVFIESWTNKWTAEEARFLQQALQGIVALNLNSKYHDETLSVLDKRLSKQRDSSSDVGDSVDIDGGS